MMRYVAVREKETEYLFIDGGCLRASVRAISADLLGDCAALVPITWPMTQGFQKVFYYDAVSGRKHTESQAAYEARVKPEHERFDLIQAQDRFHVSLGHIVGEKPRQKGVDVKLAVDMMTHAFRGHITRATLFAGDADFAPLVRALVAEGLHVTLWHPEQASAELKRAADSTRPFSFPGDRACFSFDGKTDAFGITGGSLRGDAVPPADRLTKAITKDGRRYAGAWTPGSLTIWRDEPDGTWHQLTMATGSADVEAALTVFDQLQAWGLPTSDGGWLN